MSVAAHPVRGSVTPPCADAVCGAFSSRAEPSGQGQRAPLSYGEPRPRACRPDAVSRTARRAAEILRARGRMSFLTLRIPVTMLCTSFLPAGYAVSAGGDGAALVTPASVSAHHDTAEARGPLRYNGMEIAIADIGLFFAYPWPEERALMWQLFEAVARVGALLVVYHTDTDIRVWRKVAGEGELEDPRAHVHRL